MMKFTSQMKNLFLILKNYNMKIEEKYFADNSCNDNVTDIILKKKVADGKLFFAIDGAGNICPIIQSEHNNSDLLNNIGNYFYTSKEAETMAKKLRAVLNGAEVIEMPTGKKFKECLANIPDYYRSYADGVKNTRKEFKEYLERKRDDMIAYFNITHDGDFLTKRGVYDTIINEFFKEE